MATSELSIILRSPNTVFTFKEIFLLSGETNSKLLKSRLNYYVKRGALYSIRRGIYAKNKNYNKFELATKIYTPSYISFETVLASSGIIFQKYTQIFVASYQTKEIEADGKKYSFKKIKDNILTNSLGIENKDDCSIASKERSFLDTLYLNKDYYFDNLSVLDWEKIKLILPIYGGNKRMQRKVNEYLVTQKEVKLK